MSTIDFVARDGAGTINTGTFSGASNNSFAAAAGQDISLNLQRSSVISYMRSGSALQITLVDGQVLTIDGFFGPDGTAMNRLFLSSSSQLAEVELLAGDGNLLLAQYSDVESFGKWSPDDALYFTDDGALAIVGVTNDGVDATMLGVPLLSGLSGLGGMGAGVAAAGGALLLGGSSGGGDDDPVVASDGNGVTDPDVSTESDRPTDDDPNPGPDGDDEPEGDSDPEGDGDPEGEGGSDSDQTGPAVSITSGVKSVGHTVNEEDHDDGVEISGTGTPGATGTITVGDAQQDIEIDENGEWTVTFPKSDVPGGEYETGVTVTVSNDTGTTTATDILVLDTTTTVTFDASTVETDGIVNFDEESDGVVLTGTTEAGASVVVSFAGNSYDATVSGTTWTLEVPAGVLAQGEYDLDITVKATDQFGNTASTTDTVHVDTVTSLTIDTSKAGGDGTVNHQEHPDGVYVNGVAEANASVEVTMGDYTHTVQADGEGNWEATFPRHEVPTGDYTATVNAVSTDTAGNTATASGTVIIDTEIDVTVDTSTVDAGGAKPDGVVNMVEREDGVTLSGTVDAGAQVSVEFLGTVRHFKADDSGTWSLDYDAADLPKGRIEEKHEVKVTARDEAGNVDSATGMVDFDTYVNRLEFTSGKVAGDDIVNAAEAAQGLSFSGVVEAGSTVMVKFENTTREADVDAQGNWTVSFDASEIPAGTYPSGVTIKATDRAGNVATITDAFEVDTDVPEVPRVSGQWESHEGLKSVALEDQNDSPESITLHKFIDGATDEATVVTSTTTEFADETAFVFSNGTVPDGSHLVITDTDKAGNSNSTLFAVDDGTNPVVDIKSGSLDAFNIGAIDLDFAENSEITLSAADLEAMSNNDNILVIHGGSDDTITLTDKAKENGSTVIEGRTYNVYDVGTNGGQLILDDDIVFNNGNPIA